MYKKIKYLLGGVLAFLFEIGFLGNKAFGQIMNPGRDYGVSSAEEVTNKSRSFLESVFFYISYPVVWIILGVVTLVLGIFFTVWHFVSKKKKNVKKDL